MTLLDPNFNGLPKPTDWKKVIVPLQQANEKEFRGATLTELGDELLKDKTINGQRMKAVPPGALPAGPSDKEMFMVLESPGRWTFGGNNFDNVASQLMTLWWNKNTWGIDSRVQLPVPQGVDFINPTGTDIPKEKAVYSFVEPVINLENKLKFALHPGEINDGVVGGSPNWLNAWSDVIENTEYTSEGLGLSSGSSTTALAANRINFYNGNSFISKLPSGSATKISYITPPGTTKVVVGLDAGSGVGINLETSPYLSSYKIYTGKVLKDKTLKADKIDGKIATPQIQNIEDAVRVSAISGNGAPKTQIGSDGQIYIDYSAGLAYNKALGKWGNGQVLGGQKRKFKYPEEFTWRPFDIYKLSSNGMYVPAITDISVYVISEIMKLTPYYVDPLNGSDMNSGLSPQDAVNTVGRALALGASWIYCMEGNYNRSQSVVAPIITRNVAIIAYKGAKVNMSSWDNGDIFTWSQDGSVFYTTRAGTQGVYDINYLVSEQEGYLAYTKAISLEDCKATLGSFFISGTTVYVHTKNGLQPDKSIKLNLQVETCKITLGANVDFIYMEGITTYTSNTQSGFQFRNNSTTQYNGKAYVKNCVSIRNIQGNGVAFEGIKELYVQNCGATKCGRDAMNYHTTAVAFDRMKAVEMNCWGYDTGYGSPLESSSNGSTAHDGMTIIRFGGKFEISRGSTVVDVNAGIRSLNFNTEASGSYLTTTAAFQVQDGKMWLYNCYAHTSTYAAKADGVVESPIIYYDDDSLLDGVLNGNVVQLTS